MPANNCTLPSGMHARAATIVRNPGNGHMSPAFGPARVPLVQTTLEQARAHSVAASPPGLGLRHMKDFLAQLI